MTAYTVAVVSGGLGQPSSTRLLADRLADSVRRAAGAGGDTVEVVPVELRELARDITDNLLTGFPSRSLRTALDAVGNADALIAVTPVFSGSYSGLFKSFFDVVDPQALAGKPVLVAATGGSARHSLMLEHALRPLFSYLKATVVPTGVFAATADFGSTDAGSSLTERVDRAGAELVALLTVAGRPVDAAVTGRSAAPSRRLRDADPFDNLIPFEQLLRRR